MAKNGLEKIKNEAAEYAVAEVVSINTQNDRDKALMMIGALKMTHALSQHLAHEHIKGIAMIRDEKIYESLGYSRFDDCLNTLSENNQIDLTYRQFNERELLLKEHGSDVYNLLDSLKMPMSRRKLLGAGHIQLDGETVFVSTTKDGEEIVEEIQLNDRTRLLSTLSALADQNYVLNSKTSKLSTKSEKDDAKIKQLQKDLEIAKKSPGHISIEGLHFETFMRITSSIDSYAEIIAANPIEAATINLYLDAIHAAFNRLVKAAKLSPEKYCVSKNDVKISEFADVTAALNDSELAGLID